MIIQEASDLLAEGPAQLLERTLAEYADFLEQVEDLAPEHLEAVDYALLHTVEGLLARSPDEAELESAYDELRGMVPVTREGELDVWVRRWRAFADLVDARLGTLEARKGDRPEEALAEALRFAHADRILRFVGARPGSTQAEIGEALDLKPANLSRILGVLEARELIERRAVGRVKRVHPGECFPASFAGAAEEVEYTPARDGAASLAQPQSQEQPYGSSLPDEYQDVPPGIQVFFGSQRPGPEEGLAA